MVGLISSEINSPNHNFIKTKKTLNRGTWKSEADNIDAPEYTDSSVPLIHKASKSVTWKPGAGIIKSNI